MDFIICRFDNSFSKPYYIPVLGIEINGANHLNNTKTIINDEFKSAISTLCKFTIISHFIPSDIMVKKDVLKSVLEEKIKAVLPSTYYDEIDKEYREGKYDHLINIYE